jgi:hypothetical protein
LNVNVLLLEAYDDDALSDVRQGGVIGEQLPGFYTALLASAEYSRTGRRDFKLRGTAASTFRYYNDLQEIRSVGHNAALGFSAPLPARMTLEVNQAVAYSPSFLSGLFPGASTEVMGVAPALAPDYAALDTESLVYQTSAGASRQIGRDGRISGAVNYQYTDYTRATTVDRNVESVNLTGNFRRPVSRNTSLNVGYGYRTGDYGQAEAGTTTEHRADVGFDFSRRLSASRGLSVAFSLGGSAVDIPSSSSALVSGAKYDVQGGATLQFQFAPGWATSGSYRRGVEFMPALAEPVFVDGASVSVQGMITRRVTLEMGAALASGDSILSQGDSRFDTYTGTARLQVAATRMLAFFGEYLYYFYDFSGNPRLTPDGPTTFERNSIRGGIALWIPAIER